MVFMSSIREDLKIPPRVGLRLTATPILLPGAATALEATEAESFSRTAEAASSTALTKSLEDLRRTSICSSGTVSLFFSMKPSDSYVTSIA